MTDLDRLKELLQRASPGPWHVDGGGRNAMVRGADFTIVSVRHRLPGEIHEANAELITLLRNLAPALLARLEALEGALRPFAEYAKKLIDLPDNLAVGVGIDSRMNSGHPNVADCRRAKQLLEGQP